MKDGSETLAANERDDRSHTASYAQKKKMNKTCVRNHGYSIPCIIVISRSIVSSSQYYYSFYYHSLSLFFSVPMSPSQMLPPWILLCLCAISMDQPYRGITAGRHDTAISRQGQCGNRGCVLQKGRRKILVWRGCRRRRR